MIVGSAGDARLMSVVACLVRSRRPKSTEISDAPCLPKVS